MDETEPVTSPLEAFSQMLVACRAHEAGQLIIICDEQMDLPLLDGTVCLALSRLNNPGGETAYPVVSHLRLSTQAKRKLPPSVNRCSAEGATLESVLEVLKDVPENSAVFIRSIDQIWAGRDESIPAVTVSSWTATMARVQGINQRAIFTLNKVIPALVAISKERNLLLVSVCMIQKKVWDGLADEVKDLDGLSYFADQDNDAYAPLEDALLAGVSDMQRGTKSLDDVQVEIERLAPNESSRRQAMAQVLSCAGLHHAAWQEISSILPQMESFALPVLVRTAQMALDALDTKACIKWVTLARERGIMALQDWASIVQLARSMGDGKLESELMEDMSAHFPEHETVLYWRLRSEIAAGNALGASATAGKLGRPAVANAMQVIARGGSIPEVIMQTDNDEDQGLALMTMAIVAEQKRNYLLAWEAARRVPENTPQQIYTLGMRWRLWAKRTMEREDDPSAPNRPNHKDIARLDELVLDTLPKSREVEIRHAMDNACMDTLPPTIFQSACVQLLMTELRRLRADAQGKPWNLVIASNEKQADADELNSFFSSLKNHQERKFISLGSAEPTPEFARLATPEVARSLIHTIQGSAAYASDVFTRLHLLHLVEMICRKLHDPSFDLMAALLLVRGTALHGEGQIARNLAEEVLRALPDTQLEARQWRLGLAWVVMAESALASGSARGALLPLVLGVKALRGNVVDSMLVADVLNITARLLRDLDEPKLAGELIQLENELLVQHTQSFLLQRNQHFGLMLKSKTLKPSQPDEIQRFMEEVLIELRRMETEDDRLPLLALVANCVRFLRMAQRDIPVHLTDELLRILDECEARGPSKAAALRPLLMSEFTTAWFIEQLSAASRAVRSEDADAQLHRIQIVAADGFGQAVTNNDPSLALAAAAAQCQPALLVRQSSRATNEDRAARAFRQRLASAASTDDMARLRDSYEALSTRGDARMVELDWTDAGSVEKVQGLLDPTETMVVVCVLGDHALGMLQIQKGTAPVLRRLANEEWQQELWVMLSPNIYHLLSDEDKGEVLQQLRSSPWVQPGNGTMHLIMVPETTLFGWPLAASVCSPTPSSIVGISIVPSISWLSRARAKDRLPSSRRIVWIGKGIQDKALRAAHDLIPPVIEAHGFARITDLDRETVGAASLAVLVAHGEMSAGGEMVGLRDDSRTWDLEDVGFILSDCEFVVLGCCSAGTSDTPTSSNESWSLVSSILSHGVRGVIAPVWPITVGLLKRWLNAFLPLLGSDSSVAQAVILANTNCAGDEIEKFSMQLYGDGFLPFDLLYTRRSDLVI